MTSSGDIVYIANPVKEFVPGREEILDQEREVHSEFFDGRPGLKTPDRYLKIRNFILDAWLVFTCDTYKLCCFYNPEMDCINRIMDNTKIWTYILQKIELISIQYNVRS